MPPPPTLPCIGQAVSFELENSYLLHSNIGGQGPDTGAPPSMYFVNVGSFTGATAAGLGFTVNFDLEVSARSEYMPYDSSLNQKLGKFAQINLAANHEVDLRVSMKRSCARKPSCEACKDPTLDAFAQVRCYANGCACYGTTVFAEGHCMGTEAANKRASYNCAELNQPLMLPREAVVTMTVYDFDRGTQRLCHRHPPFALLRSPLLLPPPLALPSRCLRRTLLLTRFGRARHEVH